MTAPASLWLETCGDDLSPRPALDGEVRADVAIVGAGFTGLWTAHHLLALDPSRRVVLVEREIAGWGASGRNGGWCSALFPAPTTDEMLAALRDTVDDVGRWCVDNDVPADFVKGGTLTLARGEAQRPALPPDEQLLTADQVRQRLAATDVVAGSYTPDCAALHPGKLVRGLARVVEQQGARLYERTSATEIAPGAVVTDHGVVRADLVLRATEGYTAALPGSRRLLAPVWSLVIATEPLPARVWEQVGWTGRETVTDGRHRLVYAQRTADDRIVLGGRGAPYRFGSRTGGTTGHGRVHRHLEQALHELLPATRGARVTHRWSGVLGVPRDWTPSVRLDRRTGLGTAGGYVGDGVAASFLAGRTLAELVAGRDTPRTHLPWVDHEWRTWEPEPLRWLGIRGAAAAMAVADATERRTGRSSRLAAAVDRLTRPQRPPR